MVKLRFEKLEKSHIEILFKWFNEKHVQQFYSLREWTVEEVEKKLSSYMLSTSLVHPYLAYYENLAIGYIQYYKAADFPWPDQDLTEEVIANSAGLDLFIGEVDYLGNGWGSKLIKQFLEEIIRPSFQVVIVDPDVRNGKSISFFQREGFKIHKIISCEDALKRPQKLQLMIKKLDKK